MHIASRNSIKLFIRFPNFLTPIPTITRSFHNSTYKMTSINDLSENQWKPQDAIPQFVKDLITPDLKSSKPINHLIAFLQIISSLKFQKRTGWMDHGIPKFETESIADHMYRMSILSMIVPPSTVNKDKCVKIAIIHDIAECLVGDITPFAGINKNEKHRREKDTIEYLKTIIEPYNSEFAKEMVELWFDYEEIRNIEARYVKDIDKFEMIQTAYDYELKFGITYDLEQFYTAKSAIKTKEVKELCDAVLEKRQKLIEGLKKEKK
ncbi:hypothetical protein KGF54_003999 [Candida jiufengensis]|uniref:uncharacterized protein n=1 Tax=Candida jiufengensis TaxID=497108 RepID=UPI0022242C50|nr:uncharacterized protein KGF54_003999 [Candida jiufengensis]KAI5950925.1 hypothetical protein KGF54_003999 [Candida jiufengensis]